MKKNSIILISCGLIIIFVLSVLFFKKDNRQTNIGENIVNNNSSDITNIIGKEEVEVIQTSAEIAKEMEIIINKFENNILKYEGDEGLIYKELQNDYFENYSKKTDIKNIKKYIKGNDNIEKKVEIFVFDFQNKKPIENVDIYLWGLWMGKTNKEGNLHRTIFLPKELSFYYIHAQKKGYIGGFRYINNFIENDDDINQYIELKKNISKISPYNNINIVNNDFKLILTGECNFKTLKGECYKGKVDVNVGYIHSDEVEELGFPMRATPNNGNNSVFDLTSAGMDFTEFYDKNGNILIYTKKNRIQICHYISPEKQKEVEDNIKRIESYGRNVTYDDIWNYRWFDKSKGIWIAGIDAIKTIDGNYQCYETFNP